MNQNQTESKPTDARQESGKGLDETPCCASLLQAINDLLPHHSLACVSQPDPQTTPWTFHADEEGHGLITFESCRCGSRMKEIRAMLPLRKTAGKGFSHNAKARHVEKDARI